MVSGTGEAVRTRGAGATGQERWHLPPALDERREQVIATACARIRDCVPRLEAEADAAAVRRAVSTGVEAFVRAWGEQRSLHADELTALAGPDAEPDAATPPRDAVLHAHRVVVEVIREHVEIAVAHAARDGVDAIDLLHELGHARRLERQVADALTELADRLEREQAVHHEHREQTIVDALLGLPPDLTAAARELRGFGLPSSGIWTVAVTRCDRQRVRATVPASPVTGIVGTHARATVLVAAEAPDQLCHGLGSVGPVGVARPVTALAEVRHAYEEALAVLGIAERRDDGVLHYADARLDLLLTGALSASELAAELLTPLDDLDDARREWFVQTLTAYLDEGGNVTAAARRLHLHRESLRYRLQQIEPIFGDLLGDPERRLTLHLALKAAALGQASGGPDRA